MPPNKLAMSIGKSGKLARPRGRNDLYMKVGQVHLTKKTSHSNHNTEIVLKVIVTYIFPCKLRERSYQRKLRGNLFTRKVWQHSL